MLLSCVELVIKMAEMTKAWQATPLFLWLMLAIPEQNWAGHSIEDSVHNIEVERVRKLLDAGEKLVLIDMRPLKEYQQNHLPGARSMPIDDVAQRFKEIPKSGRVILYCDCRPYDIADRAVFLDTRGYRNVFVMAEGYQGWVKRGYPLETPKRQTIAP